MSKTRKSFKKYYDPSDFEWDSNVADADNNSKEKLKQRRDAKKMKNALRDKELEADDI